jgi:hypothetical protein
MGYHWTVYTYLGVERVVEKVEVAGVVQVILPLQVDGVVGTVVNVSWKQDVSTLVCSRSRLKAQRS